MSVSLHVSYGYSALLLYLSFSSLNFELRVVRCRTAGSVLGAGFQAFISDWDKVSATVRFPLMCILTLL